MTTPTLPEPSLSRARELGRNDAERFVLRLDQVEQQEREERLAKMAWKRRQETGDTWTSEATSAEVLRLRARIDELSGYVRSVENSAPWRVIQWFRRLLGREW